MRYGIISDIHGNFHALRRALEVLAKAGVDEYLCAGDLVGYGPMPNECIAEVARIGARCVAGNHDLIALGRLADANCSDLARDSLRWTQEELSDDSRSFLEQLPTVARTADGLVMAHGSLDDPTVYLRQENEWRAQLRLLATRHPGASHLIVGHTHKQTAFAERTGTLRAGQLGSCALATAEKHLLNPGSVGQARERIPLARFMVLDLDEHRLTVKAVRYDAWGCRRSLRKRGLPSWSCHPSETRSRSVTRALRRAVLQR